MSHQNIECCQDNVLLNGEPAGYGVIKAPGSPIDKSPTHNELIEAGLKGMQQGGFELYSVTGFSCSNFEHPIQMICRHKHSGRLKIANIDRNGSVEWDDESNPWN